MPLATFDELVTAIGEGDVAPIQLQWRFVAEAREAGAVRECAFDLLVRFLRRAEHGWPADLSWEGQAAVRSALTSWQTAMKDEQYEEVARPLVDELLDARDIPVGWVPNGVEDALLAPLFEKHWPRGKSLDDLVPLERIRSRYGTFPADSGHEWRGDWKVRLLDILHIKGFTSLTDFARTAPLATLKELASRIGKGDVAASHLKWQLLAEARSTHTIRECAADLLVRLLRGVNAGWPSAHDNDGQADVFAALTEWRDAFEEEVYQIIAGGIANELLDSSSIPPGWIPKGVRDPRLAVLFEKHWPREK